MTEIDGKQEGADSRKPAASVLAEWHRGDLITGLLSELLDPARLASRIFSSSLAVDIAGTSGTGQDGLAGTRAARRNSNGERHR